MIEGLHRPKQEKIARKILRVDPDILTVANRTLETVLKFDGLALIHPNAERFEASAAFLLTLNFVVCSLLEQKFPVFVERYVSFTGEALPAWFYRDTIKLPPDETALFQQHYPEQQYAGAVQAVTSYITKPSINLAYGIVKRSLKLIIPD